MYYYYESDPTGALVRIKTNRVDDKDTAKEEIEYAATNVSGNQTKIKLGGDAQEVNFTYDQLKGWLTDINNIDALGSDKFAMKLHYDDGAFSLPRYYNGTIASSEIRYPAIGDELPALHYRYDYSYDNAQRLLSATYYEKNGVNWPNTNKYKLDNLDYDTAGNLLSLRRYNELGGDNLVSDFEYSYATGKNKLINIDKNSSTISYTYNASGNLIGDVYNNINEIRYNHQNLPKALDNQLQSYIMLTPLTQLYYKNLFSKSY